jgi:acyl carrier protein
MITAEEVIRRVRGELRGKAAVDRVLREDIALQDLGLSSLQVAEIVFGLEEDYGIKIDEARAADARTLGDLLALVNVQPAAV